MEKELKAIVKQMEKDLGATATEDRGEVSLLLSVDRITAACELAKRLGFEQLSTLTAVDYWPQQEPRFHVIYELLSVSKCLRLELRLPVNGIQPKVPSIAAIYANANWRERELWDMFGIKAEGHPDLRRLLMPADWEGHPLRKDYPLGYEEPQFTFNVEEIDLRKPYAKE